MKEEFVVTVYSDGSLVMERGDLEVYRAACMNAPNKATHCHFVQGDGSRWFRHTLAHDYSTIPYTNTMSPSHQISELRWGKPLPLNGDTINLFRFTKAVEAIAFDAMRLPEREIVFRLPTHYRDGRELLPLKD